MILNTKTKIKLGLETLLMSNMVLFFFVFSFLVLIPKQVDAAACTSAATGNWNAAATWSAPCNVVGGPTSADDVTIGNGHTITVTANAAASSTRFTAPGTGTGTGGIVVNSGIVFTVTNDITAPGLKVAGAYTLSGAGTINCKQLNVNDNTTPTGNPANTVTITSTIANLNISGNLVLTGSSNGSNKNNNPEFFLQSGTTTVSGSIQTINANTVNVASTTMNTGAQTGVLILSGATPWVISATGTSPTSLNGTGSTVIYNYAGAQTVRGTAYRNLILTSSGIKSIVTGTSVAGNLNINPTSSTTASIGAGLNISVGSLTLGGIGRNSGTWGSTSSTATNKNDVFFNATTGYVTVTSDTGRPSVSSVLAKSLTSVNVTFDETMGTGATTASNYTISESGQGSLASNPNTVTLVSGSTYVLSWSSGSMANAADITVTVANVQDSAGNIITTPNSGRSQIRGIIHFGAKINNFINGIKQYFHFY